MKYWKKICFLALCLGALVFLYLVVVGGNAEKNVEPTSPTKPVEVIPPAEPPKGKPPPDSEPEERYPPGNILTYGADPTGKIDSSAALQAAIDQAVLPGGADVYIPAGVFLLTQSVVKDNFERLVINGAENSRLDYQVSDAIKLGDHSLGNVEGSKLKHYTQTDVTARNITISGLTFKSSKPGWDLVSNPKRFSHRLPISLSAVENVIITDCEFHDWDFAAIGIHAPSKNIRVDSSEFFSSKETAFNYGVRVFAFVEDARLNPYDANTGTSKRTAPAAFHKDIVIRNNRFEQVARSIISWNVRGFEYSNNVFSNPTIRTVSVSHWNFDGVLQNNIHEVEDNTVHTLSTGIVIGMGSERITIRDEKFSGAMSGEGINNKLKLVHITGVNRDIVIRDNTFDVSNAAAHVIVGPNAGVTVESNRFLQSPITAQGFGLSNVYINDRLVSEPAFTQSPIIIRNNLSLESSRFITLNGAPADDGSLVEITGNETQSALKNGFLVTSSPSIGWRVLIRDNTTKGFTGSMIRDFGRGKTQIVHQ